MKTVMVFGAFDGLHPGHLYFFRQARKYGDELIVSVATDKVVVKYKGKEALYNQSERLVLSRNCKLVDKAVLGPEDNYYEDIKRYNPNVICLGYDQWPKENDVRRQLKEVGLAKTKVVRLKPYEEQRAKSSIVNGDSMGF